MRYFLGLFLGTIAFVMLQGAALAADAGKIGVIDIQKFQKTSKAFMKLSATVREKFEAMQQKLDQEKNALIKLEEEYRKQSMMLSLDAQEDKKRELEKKRRHYKYLQDEYNQDLKDTEIDTIRKIMKELEGIVEKIGEKEGYTMILERRTVGLIYFNQAVDITGQVTEAYDKLKR